jgi:hypothetical protein
MIWGCDVGSSTSEFIGEGEHIVERIVATEGELEATLAILAAVAGAHVAAQLGSDGHDVSDIVGMQRSTHAGDLDRHGHIMAGVRDGELRRAICRRANEATIRGGDLITGTDLSDAGDVC